MGSFQRYMDIFKLKFTFQTPALIVLITITLSVVACSEMGPKANGSHFNFGSNNNSEASLELEEIIVDGQWYAPSTGVHGCGSSNINGGERIASVSKNTPAPQETIELQWYSWKEKARMKAKVQLPDKKIINQLLLNPPWPKNKYGLDKSYFIIDFRPKHKVWIKLADTPSPKSQKEVMILAEGQGYKTDEEVTRYRHFKEGEDYDLDCSAHRERMKKIEGYSTSKVFDRWYPGAPQNKELGYE